MTRKSRRTPRPETARRTTPAPASYWAATKTPIHSLLFLLPMVVFYEVGIVWVNQHHVEQVRNGADVMLRRLVALVGRPGVAASALILVAVLLIWQAASKRSWRVRWSVLPRMAVESLVFAAVLYGYGVLYGQRLLAVNEEAMRRLPKLVLCFGAGIYEELVFRLLLVGVLVLLFSKAMGLERVRAALWAVGLSALAFAAAHYVGTMADEFRWSTFVFRFTAGVMFSAVMAFRGFGITAGMHALYDVATVLL
jgi:membrane protease YdiL (CAAX protease family)